MASFESMRLTNKQRAKFQESLERIKRACGVCQGKEFIINSNMMALVDFDPSADKNKPMLLMPVAATTCKFCGHVATFSAQALGLMDDENVGELLN